jgi:hypothetical protein
MTTQSLVRTVLVYLILGIYTLMSIYLIVDVLSGSTSLPPDTPFPYIYKTILGLISAVVVAELAITPRDARDIGAQQNFGALLAGGKASLLASNQQTQDHLRLATRIYLATWFVIGAVTFVFGALLYFSAGTLLSDTSLNWFGLIIGAGYAFFGIQS